MKGFPVIAYLAPLGGNGWGTSSTVIWSTGAEVTYLKGRAVIVGVRYHCTVLDVTMPAGFPYLREQPLEVFSRYIQEGIDSKEAGGILLGHVRGEHLEIISGH